MGSGPEFNTLINPTKYQVFVFSCPASIPIHFARHTWFVVNQKGVISRWEVLDKKIIESEHWGYLHKDAHTPFSGTRKYFSFSKKNWEGKTELIGKIEGDENSLAQKIADFISISNEVYPFWNTYSLSGPNSNTYTSWILGNFPQWKIELPKNALGKNYLMKNKIATGVVHGRFQPPHNGHMHYIQTALECVGHLYIGICTPAVCTEEEMARTGYPCAPKLNPFSYEERVAMLTLPLDAFDIPNHRYSFIPFPSDYKNLSALIPCDAVFLMSTTSNNDAKKIAHIESLGYKTKSIITIPPDQERHRSGAVRDSATAGTDWKTMVHPAIADYIEKNKLETKLAQSSKLKA